LNWHEDVLLGLRHLRALDATGHKVRFHAFGGLLSVFEMFLELPMLIQGPFGTVGLSAPADKLALNLIS
jgi:hypothetical protein